jgi:hypothetical protein
MNERVKPLTPLQAFWHLAHIAAEIAFMLWLLSK